jgi:hypothetical protein
MNDAQRYRMYAAECLSTAERRESAYRKLAFTMAACWLSLARQEEAVDGLLGNLRKSPPRPSAGSDFRLTHIAGRA